MKSCALCFSFLYRCLFCLILNSTINTRSTRSLYIYRRYSRSQGHPKDLYLGTFGIRLFNVFEHPMSAQALKQATFMDVLFSFKYCLHRRCHGEVRSQAIIRNQGDYFKLSKDVWTDSPLLLYVRVIE